MSIVLNTELCWPLAAVGPNNAVVELFEHAGRGVGDNVSHVSCKASSRTSPSACTRCCQPGCNHASFRFSMPRWLSSIVASDAGRFARVAVTPSSFSRGTVPRAMPSPNFELTPVEPALSTCPSASVSGWPRWRLQGCHARGAALGTKERTGRVSMFAGRGGRPVPYYKLQVTENGGL